ncbi:MAG: multifunctional oxoglutarate decarboxylase/oxoglutarate dehydrogenase thiamine pyrophosphate-binding subunit/dihydrolipoyllysine-residue succinyltransferase subunit [Arcanobacterium sp.]|nr:multifunctional oxoglutarate decarboxylase/oxoglutarate dehydrogenase thiamine pyrophosphate-binding subunit/dihydrolipoyllysine-residue succinyltransferase subunit [Arcanobacterium sp.]
MAANELEDFGPNQGFINDLYASFLKDHSSVGAQWLELFDRWEREGKKVSTDTSAPAESSAATENAATPEAEDEAASDENAYGDVTRSDLPPLPRVAVVPPKTPYAKKYDAKPEAAFSTREDEYVPLKGLDRGLAKNMDASLSMPTATTVRSLPARIMFDNRSVINKHLAATRGGKVSFTHIIAYAMVEALSEMPEMNYSYTVDEHGRPTLVKPAHVNLGLAIDVTKPDGSRTLVVPNIKKADTLTFAEFLKAYEDIVARGRDNKLTLEDYTGTTASLTNPGGFGTVHSIPRLMNGQAVIVGVGSMTYPPEFQGTSESQIARLGVSKVVHLTSTYDHRVIQGGVSGRFLRLMEQKLLGQDGLYDRIFTSLRVPYKPFSWVRDVEYNLEREFGKSARIAEFIHAYRSRGHLIADIDPLSFHIRRHPDLELRSYGLSIWDLDRSFPVGGFMGKDRLTLREIYDQLRETYCRSVGVEYMHIQDPTQRKWIQERIERPLQPVSKAEHIQIMKQLNEAEAFETFLQTKYVGQKRFSLEGGESLIPAIAAMLTGAIHDGLRSSALAMAHRGRLNVLTNIAGKSYKQIFTEFDGVYDPGSLQGTGDVKYHLGTGGVFTMDDGTGSIPVYIGANPSHLEAADGVIEGVVRAKEDRFAAHDESEGKEPRPYDVLPIMIHGDAAFSGQGVVAEVLNFSNLPGYRVGGTIHIIVNNQIGFTTAPSSARSSHYTTDIAKGLQVPIFHVNGDDPEAVVRVSKLAYAYRAEFHKDVVVDLICYRKRGHNEGDDPSMTQPIMYSLVNAKKSPREIYKQSLIGRGLISEEGAEKIEQSFHQILDAAFTEVREAEAEMEKTPKVASEHLGLTKAQTQDAAPERQWRSAVPLEVIHRIGDAHTNPPEGFALHRKISQLFKRRKKMAYEGGIDWGFGEVLAFGSLLIEGVPIRMSGQDSRRGTFVQRQAVAHSIETGEEWTPLANLTEDQAPLAIYDSSLSEYSVLAFEYGYSVERPDALVLWEAQFGDFANGAQTVIDEFISSAEAKWNQHSSLVMLLPHGYEGQGPDHSSARIERYLGLCADENMIVAQPSTPANYFHLLRRQAYQRPRKPLIAITPKQLLRRKGVVSAVEEFTSGSFKPVIGEVNPQVDGVQRVILCSGRVYYDLAEKRDAEKRFDVAIVRLEQLYPNPVAELSAELAKYPGAEILWVQDEPANMGAWSHLAVGMFPQLGLQVRLVSRPASAAPSTGLTAMHKVQAERLMNEAFAG